MMTSGATQSLGSGMPTAVWWPCVCCWACNRCSSLQQSCRNTVARLHRRGLSEREKRSMHCTMASSVTTDREDGVTRFISVVMADRTVSSLRLDRQLVTRRIPLLCRIMSRHSGSILRLQRPPKGWEQEGFNVEVSCMSLDYSFAMKGAIQMKLYLNTSSKCDNFACTNQEFDVTHPFQTPQSFHSPQWACPWRGRAPEAPSGSQCFLGRRQSWPGWLTPAPLILVIWIR